MATELTVRVNIEDASQSFEVNEAVFLDMNLDEDYLLWTEGSEDVIDKMDHEPTEAERNAAAVIIDEVIDKEVPLCLFVDASGEKAGPSIFTHEVKGMGDNDRFVYCFSFDGSTASEPTLEAWDNDSHDSIVNHVLGNTEPNNSMIKAVCTTNGEPGTAWEGSPLAGENVLLLNDGAGALDEPATGVTNDLYANLKIVIPADYPNPAIEGFVLTVRYTWS